MSHNAEGWRKAHTHQYSGTCEAVSLQEKTNSSSCTILALSPSAMQISATLYLFSSPSNGGDGYFHLTSQISSTCSKAQSHHPAEKWSHFSYNILRIQLVHECCNEKLLEVSLPCSGSKGAAQGISPSSPKWNTPFQPPSPWRTLIQDLKAGLLICPEIFCLREKQM